MPFIEIRSDSVFISGYANITEKESHFLNENGRRFKEVILPKAFEKGLSRAKDVLLLLNHDEDKQLASVSSGGLKLFENEIGLKVEAEIREAAIVQKVKEDRSFLSSWSFGFVERASKWLKKDGYDQRRISDLDILEVSLLSRGTDPAYPSAKVIEVRSDGILERRYTDFEIKKHVDLSRYENEIKYLNLKGCRF